MTAEAQTDTVEPSPTATTTNAGHTTGQAPPASEIALKQLLGPVRPSIVLAFCCGMAGAALGLLPAIGVTALAQQALAATLTARTAWAWVAAISVGLMGGHMIYLWGTGYAHRVELRFRTDLRRRIAVVLARLPLGWHTEESSGRVRSTITEDTAKVHALIAHFGSDLGMAIGAPLFGLVYLLTRSWVFTLVLLVWLAAAVAVAGQTGGESLSELALRAGRAGADMRTLALSGPDAEPDAVADAISSLLRPDDELLTVILGRDALPDVGDLAAAATQRAGALVGDPGAVEVVIHAGGQARPDVLLAVE